MSKLLTILIGLCIGFGAFVYCKETTPKHNIRIAEYSDGYYYIEMRDSYLSGWTNKVNQDSDGDIYRSYLDYKYIKSKSIEDLQKKIDRHNAYWNGINTWKNNKRVKVIDYSSE